MKKFFINPNPQTKHGYEFIVEHDDGTVEVHPMNKKTGDGYIFVPEMFISELNRKLVKFTDFEGKGKYEVTIREGKTKTASGESKPKATLAELGNLLTSPEDKAMWQELCKKIEHAKLIAKAKAEYEAAKAKYESMKGGK